MKNRTDPVCQIATLPPQEQALLVGTIESEQLTLSVFQTRWMRKLSQDSSLNEDTMPQIMIEQKKP